MSEFPLGGAYVGNDMERIADALERSANALERMANVLDAQEDRECKRLADKKVAEDHNVTRACRLMIKLYESDKKKGVIEMPEPGVYKLARRPLPGDEDTFTIGGQITHDAGRTWTSATGPGRRDLR